ncbi:uncharacterized protein LOC141586276 isoform X2 [Silene latifolia]|uniref:uncharacterized protein LOC141586276 isoform X2 n=1 Tax=Silene latifolia TaxID=37657 RepID=UPI003D77AC08
MNEGVRCQGKGNMIGSGGDDGGDGDFPVSRPPAPAKFPANSPENSESVVLGVDLYTQAIKALSERSPFDSAEVLAKKAPTLPSVLSSLLSKHSDSRRKHKRHHLETKKSRKSSEKSKNANIWVEWEKYFRELALLDVERLYRLSLSFSSLDSVNSFLTIPVFRNAIRSNDGCDNNGDNNVVDDHVDDGVLRIEDVPAENVAKEENGHGETNRDVDCSDMEIEEEVEKECDKPEVSIEKDNNDKSSVVPSTQLCSSIEWVLGSRNRVLLATTRPTKKRKLLGENAGLERLMVAQPCEGSSSLCHVCSIGDTGDQLNSLVVCKSCKVVVHQKCYGVQGEVNESWTCSLCKHKSDAVAGNASSSDRPCVLCPKSGGASKRFQRSGAEGSVEFAHLFCGQWMPEVHIEDTRMMEPLICAEGIKDVREKLLCNLCKIRVGSSVRCSDGSCRASIHPICAREARNKLEIWGKFGCDDIELRAFCGKHSGDNCGSGIGTMENNEHNDAFSGDSLAISVQQGNKIKKLKIGCKNGDRVISYVEAADANTNSSAEHVSQDVMQNGIKSKTELNSGSGDHQGSHEVKPPGQKVFPDKIQYVDLGAVLKKLLERGKVSLEQIASEISTTEDSLATKLASNHLGPEMSCKVLKWLTDHAYMNTSEKDLRAKVRRLMPPKAELVSEDPSDGNAVMDLDMPDVVPVKSVPQRRRTVGNIVKEEKVTPLWNDKPPVNDTSIKDEIEQEQVNGDHDQSSKDAIADGMEKIVVETNGFEHSVEEPLPASESILVKSLSPCNVDSNVAEEVTLPRKPFVLNLDQEPPPINTAGYFDGDFTPGPDSFVHPYIEKKLEEVQCLLVKKTQYNGWTETESSAVDQSQTTGDDADKVEQRNEGKLGDLQIAKKMGILDLSPENEVEGEIIFSQQRLLCNAVALKHRADQLVRKVVRGLPDEIDAVRKRRWDDVLVNQYVYELKEARKQSRKERRHKEAQAVLAAATAAAAASSRVSSLRKDTIDESSQQENPFKMEVSGIREGLSSLPVPRPKEFNSSFDVPKAISDGYSDMFQYSPGSPKEHFKSCDICRRTESLLNPILICLSCKVAVHMNCYRSVKESTGPWYCELCEESFSSKASRTTLEKPYPIAECGLCGASNGAFRKSSNGQWIHAICAEWVFDSTFRRGQAFPVEGMETLVKGNDICSVCNRRFGACIKCNYGNCQATFHPSCGRSAGYYMYTKYIGGGKMQHKAYCCKHSSDQKVKADTQKHGAEDLKVVKQHRVELEKLRLLCERIVKREKLKRELVLCNYDILASKRDSLPLSMLARRPFLPPEGSSESATTSLKGNSRSCSEAMQKSDDVTVDSALSSKRCIRLPPSIDHDQKTDDGSTSQRISTPKPTERTPFAGKQIPARATTSRRNVSQSGEKMVKSRKVSSLLPSSSSGSMLHLSPKQMKHS